MEKKLLSELSPAKALGLGVGAGLILVCVVGFVVMLGLYLTKGDDTKLSQNLPVNTQSPQQVLSGSITASEVPDVELFVMSYCPYGLQMQKAILPVMELLGDKINVEVKFVDYILHGEKEATENTRQYCVQKNEPEKYLSFMKCFAGSGEIDSCMTSAGVDKTAIESCMSAATQEFGISGTNYPIHTEENVEYGVQGSPTLVINGAVVSPATRSPEAVKDLICSAFIDAPVECDTELDSATASSGFGFNGEATAEASC